MREYLFKPICMEMITVYVQVINDKISLSINLQMPSFVATYQNCYVKVDCNVFGWNYDSFGCCFH